MAHRSRKGRHRIPLGWAVDEAGRPTEDPGAALRDAVLPFGGPKGYVVGLLVQILCSVLSGAHSDAAIPSFWRNLKEPLDPGSSSAPCAPTASAPLDTFERRIPTLIEGIKATPPSAGTSQVFLPGEIELNNFEHAAERGVQLSDAVVEDPCDLSREYGVDWSFLLPPAG